jgi:hypothetical protein
MCSARKVMRVKHISVMCKIKYVQGVGGSSPAPINYGNYGCYRDITNSLNDEGISA